MNKSLVEAAPFLLVACGLNCWHYPRLAGLIERGRKIDRGDEEQQALELVERLQAAPAASPRKPGPRRTQPQPQRPAPGTPGSPKS
jgi:hypothetical protein